mgnify:CR=1 FL=1
MVRLTLRVAAVCAAALVSPACSLTPPPASARTLIPVKERKRAPDFALNDSTGKTVRLSDYKGKVVLLNFWATWCGPCKFEIPWFMEFEQKYKDRGFAVLGVAMDDEGWDIVKPYIERMKVNYRVMVATAGVDRAYGEIESLPTTVLIDRDGHVAAQHVGMKNRSEFEVDIEQLLEAPRAQR